jgi:methylation protein EvaC
VTATLSGTHTYREIPGVSITSGWLEPKSHACHSCGSPLSVFLDQGEQPIANGFVNDPSAVERTFRIQWGFCPACFLAQMVEQPPADVMFHREYAFLSGSSDGMRRYYAALAAELRSKWQPKSVIEVGSNDGTLLEHFKDLDHLGIDASENVNELARAKGLNVWTRLWNADTACLVAATWRATDQDIQRLVGRNVDLIVGCHVLTHLQQIGDFFAAADIALSPKGVVVVEDPSLDRIVTGGDYAQLYDEHACALSLPALQNTMGRYGFEIIDAQPQAVHGGSMRVTAARKGVHPVNAVVPALMQGEKYLTNRYTFRSFNDDTQKRLGHLQELLTSLHESGKRIAAYGASSKLALTLTLLEQRGFDPAIVEVVTDTTPTKVGKFMPGTHNPIKARAEVDLADYDYLLLGAYVHLKECSGKERDWLAAGGKWVVWTPAVKTIGAEGLL